MPLLEIRNLQIEFGTGHHAARAVDGVSFCLEPGKALCLVGESGSGKSATALSIAKLMSSPPANYVGGEILVEGKDVLKMSPRALRAIRGGLVSYVFQEPSASLNPVFQIGTQIKESLKCHRPASATDAEVIRLLNLVSIPVPESRLKSYPYEMSGGMQQRVVIAMALASQPKLLVADEPTTGLDVTIQCQIVRLLCDLRRQLGMAVLLITHNFGLVSDVADDVAVMYAGQIVEQGPVWEVLKRPLHPYTQALIAAIPSLDARVDRLAAIPGTIPLPGTVAAGCRFQPRCPKAQASCSTLAPELSTVDGCRRVRCPLWRTEDPSQYSYR